VQVRISPGSTGDKYYYYPPSVRNPIPSDDYGLIFNLELQNKGSADSLVGVYVSGYDPNFIQLYKEGQPIVPEDAGFRIPCNFGVGSIIGGILSGRADCDFGRWGEYGCGYVGGEGVKDQSVCDAQVNLGDVFNIDGLDLQMNVRYDSSTGRFMVEGMGQGAGVSGYYYDDDINNGRRAIMYISSLHIAMFDRNFINEGKGWQRVLMGDRKTWPGGQVDYVNFEGKVKEWPRGLEQTEQIFQFTSCYIYTSYADPMICVDPAPDSIGRKVCTPRTVTFPRGQGAPVAITKIEQESAGSRVIFTIYVENKGGGMVYHPLALDKCNPWEKGRVTEADLNYVFLGDIRLIGDQDLVRCHPESRIIKLQDGRGQITCEYPIQFHQKSAYQVPLVVALYYGYSDTVQKRVTFKRG
ncbi:MAG: hypothetical protein ABIH41_01135, partial [Nanoarchaeota archaeon]